MRIIAGSARGRTFDAPQGKDTRPPLDRVRENVFNILQMKVRGAKVLDLFSGSGAMAFEAVSRGAEEAVLVDIDRAAHDVQRQNAAKLRMDAQCRMLQCDWQTAVRQLAAAGEKFSVIFLDPPYDSGLVPEALRSLHKNGLAALGAAIVCETDNGTDARPSRRHVDPAETEAKEAAAVTEQVFGGDETLAEAYTVEKSVSYGRTRITVLRPAKEEA